MRLRALAGAPAAFSSTYADSLTFSDEAWQRRASECAASTRTSLFFAEREGALVGMAGGFFKDGEAVPSLISMWVDPEARGLGGAEALIEAVAAWARAGGAQSLALWVFESNARARTLYRRVGFTETGETQVEPRRPADIERRMIRAL
jgi:GNAT superfamily N-acetyltransferase